MYCGHHEWQAYGPCLHPCPSNVYCDTQAEDKEGETSLSVAANKVLRQLLVDIATGKASADELMHDL